MQCADTNGTDPTKCGGEEPNIVKYKDVPKCVALVCPRPSDPLGRVGRCKNQWGQKCEIECQRGYASGGKWSRAGQPIVFTCMDAGNRTGVFQAEWEPCAELS